MPVNLPIRWRVPWAYESSLFISITSAPNSRVFFCTQKFAVEEMNEWILKFHFSKLHVYLLALLGNELYYFCGQWSVKIIPVLHRWQSISSETASSFTQRCCLFMQVFMLLIKKIICKGSADYNLSCIKISRPDEPWTLFTTLVIVFPKERLQ